MEIFDPQIEEIYKDIETIKTQGATNVALATLKGMQIAASKSGDDILENVESVGFKLSTARQNEPLARNAVKFVLSSIHEEQGIELPQQIDDAIERFRQMLADAKEKIKLNGANVLKDFEVVLTHCHSSTSTNALIAASKLRKDFKVVSTETRPLFQGRKTANGLLEAGVSVTQIVDSASASFIVDDRYLPVGAVLVGADEVFVDGRVINKVGSYQIALAAKEGKDPFYVAATLLKIDIDGQSSEPQIEMRASSEVWPEAPKGLNIINPSFELIPAVLIKGYITEAGVLEADELEDKLKQLYPWI